MRCECLGFINRLLINIAFSLVSQACFGDDDWYLSKRADIYLKNWGEEHRAGLTADDISGNYDVHFRISPINSTGFLNWLGVEALTPTVPMKYAPDLRLVIELESETGHILHFYADEFNLYNQDFSKSKTIDCEFKMRFLVRLQLDQDQWEGLRRWVCG